MALESTSTFATDLRSNLPGNSSPSLSHDNSPRLSISPTSEPRPSNPTSPGTSKRPRPSPPRLSLPGSARLESNKGDQGELDSTLRGREMEGGEGGPVLFVQPASPAMTSASSTFATSPTSTSFPANTPFPLPIPSTSSSSPPGNNAPLPLAPPSPGGGLAARRAAKLGKKRLSLVVPTSNHIAANSSLLSPTTPSHLRTTTTEEEDQLLEAETRSLPPSPISLVTFIGTEGSEAPDRTIGRLMLKQQADEMREQMKGGRGMKRRTSILRLSLASNGNSQGGTSPSKNGSSKPKPTLSTMGSSAVQFLRRETSELDDGEGEVEEFPYALGPREILPGIYLGSEQNAKDPQVLREWKFGFVLNVAKEVECPWVDEEVVEEEEKKVDGTVNGGQEEVEGSQPKLPTSPPRKHKHRRTKTQAAVDLKSPGATSPSSTATNGASRPIRPPFIRPTASTPNLQSVFRSSSSSTNAAPPLPPLPLIHIPTTQDTSEGMLRSLSSSPPASSHPVPRRSPPRVRIHPHNPPASAQTQSTCRSKGVVRFPSNRQSGRPSLEYLWLKWGHDEADLVEAQKFQAAFDFLDEARSRNEKVLVHCQCGVSRSATVVIAYCMREAAKALEEGRDAEELAGCTGMHDTYSFVKEKSEWVGPNLGLVFQLVAYERTLRGDSTDFADDEEPAYPYYPPEPVSSSSPNGILPKEASQSTSNPTSTSPHLFRGPQTPISLDGSKSRSEFSTPELHHPLSPTFSSGTRQSSVTSTPISHQLSDGPRIAQGGDNDEPEFGFPTRERHGSSETLKGEPAVFVLSPPPTGTSPSHDDTLQQDILSPTIASYPSPAPSPLEFSSKTRTARRPPPLLINGQSSTSPGLVASPTTLPSPRPARTAPTLTLPTLKTSGLSSLTLPVPSPGAPSPNSAITTSSDSSGNSTSQATTNGHRKFGAQSKSERRASHRRVFSETISVPNAIKSSWSSHSLHSGGGEE